MISRWSRRQRAEQMRSTYWKGAEHLRRATRPSTPGPYGPCGRTLDPKNLASSGRGHVRVASSGRKQRSLSPVEGPFGEFEAIAGGYPVYRIEVLA
jgi:hypothetical protein